MVGPFALLRIRGKWVQTEKGYFSLGRAGLAVSIAAFIWGVGMIVNIAWPRRAIYNPVAPFRWWLQWGGILFPAVFLTIAFLFTGSCSDIRSASWRNTPRTRPRPTPRSSESSSRLSRKRFGERTM